MWVSIMAVKPTPDIARALEAEAHRVAAVMRALESADPRVVQALAAVGMQPGHRRTGRERAWGLLIRMDRTPRGRFR